MSAISNNSKQLHVAAPRCSSCGRSHDRSGQRQCAECHARTMRLWRAELRGQQERTAEALSHFDQCLGALEASMEEMRVITQRGEHGQCARRCSCSRTDRQRE